MLINQFEKSGWNQSLLTHLAMHGCAGIELRLPHGREYISDDDIIQRCVDFIANAGYPCKLLMLGHRALQPYNRLTYYKGILKQVGVRDEYSAQGEPVEWSVKNNGGIRFYGVVRNENVKMSLLKLFQSETVDCWLAFSSIYYSANDFRNWLIKGWGISEFLPSGDLLEIIRTKKILLFRYLETGSDGLVCIIVGPAKEVGIITAE